MYLFSKYIYIYFIPTSMFTATSWVSHLLPPTSYPARTSLLVTTFLCQVGIFNSALQNTPNGDEGCLLKIICFVFIFCLLSAFFANYMSRYDFIGAVVLCLHHLYLHGSPQLCPHLSQA